MAKVKYNKLWKLLIDKGMNRGDLRIAAGMGAGTMAKLGKDEPVSMDVLLRVCQVLDCDIGEVMEVIQE